MHLKRKKGCRYVGLVHLMHMHWQAAPIVLSRTTRIKGENFPKVSNFKKNFAPAGGIVKGFVGIF